MKINEFAILTESRTDEAPIGMFKRLGTGLAGFFSSSQAAESKVQAAINAMYKEYKNFYTPTNEKRPTGENLKQFIVATGYPLEKKYGSLTGLYAQVEKAKKQRSKKPIKPTEPEAQPDSQNGDDKTIPFPQPNNPGSQMVQGTYEALDIQADSNLTTQQVEDIIEFIVRDSYQDDKIKDLAPGAYTQKLRTLKKKQEKQKQQKSQSNTKTLGSELVQGDDGVFRFQ